MKLEVVEGNTQRLDGGAMFGNAPKPLWTRWIEADELNRIPMACRCLLMTTDGGKRILFETGIGDFFEPALKARYGVVESGHRLLDNLAAVGVSHESIDLVVLSHLHFDHAGGLLSSYQPGTDATLLFPNAQYLVGAKQWQHAQSPHYRDRASYLPELHQQLQASGRLLLVDETNAGTVIPQINFIFSDGHTPGLMLAEIATASGPLLFSSDLIPGQFWVHLPICMGYDRFPEKLIDEKQQVLESLLARNGRLFFTHDHTMACGRVQRDEKGRYAVSEVDL